MAMISSGLPSHLRFTTWLAPGLPEDLFGAIAAGVAEGVGCSYELVVEARFSGPTCIEEDPFRRADADVGFLCPPSFLWLSGQVESSVALVPLAPVHDDPRGEGRPVYFSDVVVRADATVSALADLAGLRVGFNDHASLSGYVSLLGRLHDERLDPSVFGEFIGVGSHRRALSLIAAGRIDAAAVDANVWRDWRSAHGGEASGLRSALTLGPFPVQPIVVRADLAEVLIPDLCRELTRPQLIEAVRPHGVTGFAPVAMSDYEPLRPLLSLAGIGQRSSPEPPG
jgi:phosphonate transport system substrate-binding protein